jgi:hypothetical protein
MERHKLCLNRHVLSFIRHSTGLGQRSSITLTSPHLTHMHVAREAPDQPRNFFGPHANLSALPTCHPRTNRLNPTTDPVQIQPAYRFHPPSFVSALPLNVRARCAGRAVPGKDSFTDSAVASRKPLPHRPSPPIKAPARPPLPILLWFRVRRLVFPFLVSTPRRVCVFSPSLPSLVSSRSILSLIFLVPLPLPLLSQILNLAAATVR